MSDLTQLFDAQRDLQITAYGKDPADLEGMERIQFYKDMHIALTDELHEALGEIGWKPWATSRHVNEEALQGELVDAFHFFMNLCMVAHLDPFELVKKYMAKREKNAKRQAEGYDGVSTKCPVCKRALDDDAVLCGEENTRGGVPGVWCDEKKDWFIK